MDTNIMVVQQDSSQNETKRLRSLHRLQILDTPLEERFERIVRLARRHLSVPMAFINFVDEDRIWPKSAQGMSAIEGSRVGSPCDLAIQSPDLLVIEDLRQFPHAVTDAQVIEKQTMCFYAGYPLQAPDGERVGTLCVGDFMPRQLNEAERELLQAFGAMVEAELQVVSLSRGQLELLAQLEAARRQNLLDPLTGVWNRRGIQEVLQREAVHAQRHTSALGVIYCDIDYFKVVNDTFGHSAGDQVLKEVASRMVSVMRPYDAIGRYGGEEFLVVMADKDAAVFTQVAQRIHASIKYTPIMVGETSVPVTISLGVAISEPAEPEAVDALIDRADKALYVAKAGGRNRVHLAAGAGSLGGGSESHMVSNEGDSGTV